MDTDNYVKCSKVWWSLLSAQRQSGVRAWDRLLYLYLLVGNRLDNRDLHVDV
jgi:hypothetical protein